MVGAGFGVDRINGGDVIVANLHHVGHGAGVEGLAVLAVGALTGDAHGGVAHAGQVVAGGHPGGLPGGEILGVRGLEVRRDVGVGQGVAEVGGHVAGPHGLDQGVVVVVNEVHAELIAVGLVVQGHRGVGGQGAGGRGAALSQAEVAVAGELLGGQEVILEALQVAGGRALQSLDDGHSTLAVGGYHIVNNLEGELILGHIGVLDGHGAVGGALAGDFGLVGQLVALGQIGGGGVGVLLAHLVALAGVLGGEHLLVGRAVGAVDVHHVHGVVAGVGADGAQIVDPHQVHVVAQGNGAAGRVGLAGIARLIGDRGGEDAADIEIVLTVALVGLGGPVAGVGAAGVAVIGLVDVLHGDGRVAAAGVLKDVLVGEHVGGAAVLFQRRQGVDGLDGVAGQRVAAILPVAAGIGGEGEAVAHPGVVAPAGNQLAGGAGIGLSVGVGVAHIVLVDHLHGGVRAGIGPGVGVEVDLVAVARLKHDGIGAVLLDIVRRARHIVQGVHALQVGGGGGGAGGKGGEAFGLAWNRGIIHVPGILIPVQRLKEVVDGIAGALTVVLGSVVVEADRQAAVRVKGHVLGGVILGIVGTNRDRLEGEAVVDAGSRGIALTLKQLLGHGIAVLFLGGARRGDAIHPDHVGGVPVLHGDGGPGQGDFSGIVEIHCVFACRQGDGALIAGGGHVGVAIELRPGGQLHDLVLIEGSVHRAAVLSVQHGLFVSEVDRLTVHNGHVVVGIVVVDGDIGVLAVAVIALIDQSNGGIGSALQGNRVQRASHEGIVRIVVLRLILGGEQVARLEAGLRNLVILGGNGHINDHGLALHHSGEVGNIGVGHVDAGLVPLVAGLVLVVVEDKCGFAAGLDNGGGVILRVLRVNRKADTLAGVNGGRIALSHIEVADLDGVFSDLLIQYPLGLPGLLVDGDQLVGAVDVLYGNAGGRRGGDELIVHVDGVTLCLQGVDGQILAGLHAVDIAVGLKPPRAGGVALADVMPFHGLGKGLRGDVVGVDVALSVHGGDVLGIAVDNLDGGGVCIGGVAGALEEGERNGVCALAQLEGGGALGDNQTGPAGNHSAAGHIGVAAFAGGGGGEGSGGLTGDLVTNRLALALHNRLHVLAVFQDPLLLVVDVVHLDGGFLPAVHGAVVVEVHLIAGLDQLINFGLIGRSCIKFIPACKRFGLIRIAHVEGVIQTVNHDAIRFLGVFAHRLVSIRVNDGLFVVVIDGDGGGIGVVVEVEGHVFGGNFLVARVAADIGVVLPAVIGGIDGHVIPQLGGLGLRIALHVFAGFLMFVQVVDGVFRLGPVALDGGHLEVAGAQAGFGLLGVGGDGRAVLIVNDIGQAGDAVGGTELALIRNKRLLGIVQLNGIGGRVDLILPLGRGHILLQIPVQGAAVKVLHHIGVCGADVLGGKDNVGAHGIRDPPGFHLQQNLLADGLKHQV